MSITRVASANATLEVSFGGSAFATAIAADDYVIAVVTARGAGTWEWNTPPGWSTIESYADPTNEVSLIAFGIRIGEDGEPPNTFRIDQFAPTGIQPAGTSLTSRLCVAVALRGVRTDLAVPVIVDTGWVHKGSDDGVVLSLAGETFGASLNPDFGFAFLLDAVASGEDKLLSHWLHFKPPGTSAVPTVAGWTSAVRLTNADTESSETTTTLFLGDEPSALVPPDPGEPSGPSSQSPLDRYRSSISADAGSLLATTRAVPFDTSHSIAFSPAGELGQDSLYPFHEAPSAQSGTPDVMFYPRARQSLTGPVEYDGVTILTLMERVYPNQILTRTSTISLGDTATAQQIINYVFQQWATQYAWFTYKPVPDLRLQDVSITTGWADARVIARTTLRDAAIRVLQPKGSPNSMRAMLEDLLSPFPGTQFFMDSAGDLVIRPVYGPDADASPFKTLATSDVVTISIGEPSVDQIINRSTVSLRRFTEQKVSVLEPAFLQVLSNALQPAAGTYLITPPTDREDLSLDDGGFGGWHGIPLGEDLLLGAGGILFEDLGGPLITAGVNTYDTGGTLQEAWTSPGDLTIDILNTVPLDGTTVLAFGVRRGAGYTSNSYHGRWNARYNGSMQAVEIQWAGGQLEVNTAFSSTARYAQMSITINGVSQAWTEGAPISATFGVVADGDFVPGPSSTNALAASVTAFGVLEERFEIRGYGSLEPEALARIAEARVIQNLTPRATREIALGWKGAVGLEFDDRGRLVGIPGDGEGFLTGMRNADDFIAVAGGKTVAVEETIPGSPGVIDFETAYLLDEGGAFWLNENETVSPPA